MSRVSLWNRIERLRNHLLVPGSLEHRLENVSDAERESFKSWQRDSADIISRHETEPGASYAAMIEGGLDLPKLPRALELKVWPEMAAVYAESDPARAYQLMLDGLER